MRYYIKMLRTVSIPIKVEQDSFFALFSKCAKIFNIHVDWALENGTYNKGLAHAAIYERIRKEYSDVPSALIQTVRDTAMEAVKATRFKKRLRKRPTSGIRYDKRTMTLRGRQLTLSCIGKRKKVILDVPDYFKEVFETGKFKMATVNYRKNSKSFFVNLVFEIPTPEKIKKEGIQGIDRGLYHIAVTSDNQFFSNSKVRSARRKYLYNRGRLQAKGTPSAKRRLRAVSGREKRFSRNVNHVITKQIANQHGISTFVLEDLKGIRNIRRGHVLNKWIGNWPFHQFEKFLSYKVEALGKDVVFVDARYTSQRCSSCGHLYKGNRKKSRFSCVHCKYHAHADVNAAVNIRNAHILSVAHENAPTEQVAVNQPYATSCEYITHNLVASRQPCAGDS